RNLPSWPERRGRWAASRWGSPPPASQSGCEERDDAKRDDAKRDDAKRDDAKRGDAKRGEPGLAVAAGDGPRAGGLRRALWRAAAGLPRPLYLGRLHGLGTRDAQLPPGLSRRRSQRGDGLRCEPGEQSLRLRHRLANLRG